MNIITLIIVAVFSIIMLYRICSISGAALPNQSSLTKYITSNKQSYSSDNHVNIYDILRIAAESLAFRIFIYFISYLALILIYRDSHTFLDWWLKWDATNYIGIAEGGYKNIVVDNVAVMGDGVYQTLVFFPLYPALTWLVSFIIRNVQIAALVTSSLCYAGGCIFLYMAAALKYNKSIAEKTVILISVFPFSFFFGAMLPESTFLLVGSACIYFTFKKKWWIAGLFGMLGALSRMQGILLVVFMGIEWLESNQIFLLIRKKEWRTFFSKLIGLIPILMVVLGSFIYLLINYINTGDFMYFMKLQNNVWGHSFKDVGCGIQNIFNNLLADDVEMNLKFSVWAPQLILFFLTIYMLFRCFRRHRDSLTAFLFVYTLISYSTDFLVSGGRYLSIALPLFMFTAELCEKRPVLYRWLIMTGLLLQMVLMCCHLSGFNMVT